MGYELVRVLLHGSQRPTLQVMAERADRAPMTVEHCAEISRAVSAILDVADPIAGAYRLEVTSPGLDRPLTRRADFERFRGFEARVETELPIEGRRRFRGRLLGVVDDKLRLQLADGERAIPCDGIKKAKLIVTGEVLSAAAEQRS
jgi:ribosome maturation factor RimP